MRTNTYTHSYVYIHGYDNIEKLVDYLASLDRNVPTVEEMDLLIQGMLGTYSTWIFLHFVLL